MSQFPARLDEVPESERLPEVHETMGLGFAIGGLVVGLGQVIEIVRHGFDFNRAKYSGGALLIGILCAVFQYLDRRNPLVLVPRGLEIGVYRSGQFIKPFKATQVGEYQLRVTNTIRELASFGILGPIAFFATFAMPVGSLEFFWVLGGAIALNLTLVGTVRVRMLSRYFMLPDWVSKDKAAFTKSSLRRVGLIR